MEKFYMLFVVGFVLQNVYSSQVFISEGINEGTDGNNNNELRLSNTTVPTKYNINLKTFLNQQNKTYVGEVDIFFYVQVEKNELFLNGKLFQNMTLDLFDSNNESLNATFEIIPEKNFIIVNVPYYLSTNDEYRFSFKFENNYESGQTDSGFFYNGKVAATHFEPNFARLAFPCFDEPGFKSYFNISIDHNSEFTAISNMPLERVFSIESNNGTMSRSIFQTTPLMPTYLISFVIFKNYNNYSLTINNLEHRVFFPMSPTTNSTIMSLMPGQDDYNKLDMIVKSAACIDVLEKALKIKYPLKKLDHFPALRKFGGMENWGLILYKSEGFLKKGMYQGDEYFETLSVIFHEISHQWFGNLVTPKWWSSIWISEGMSTYFSYVVMKTLMPQIQTEKFLNDKINSVIFNGFKILTDFNTTTEIASFVNVETYYKSAGVIKMFHHAIGIDKFMSGLQTFLQENAYKSIDDNDLFSAIDLFNNNQSDDDDEDYSDNTEYYNHDKPELIENIPSSIMMSTWIKNKGIPLVTVERNYGMDTITIHQRPYNRNNNNHIYEENPDNVERWWIPINFASGKHQNFHETTADILMPPKEKVTYNIKDIGLSNLTDDDWLIIDKQNTGLYVVEYDEKNNDLIVHGLLEYIYPIMPSQNRAVIFRDLLLNFNNKLSKANLKNILYLIKYIQYEKDVAVLASFSELVLRIINKLGQDDAVVALKSYIRCNYAKTGQLLLPKIINKTADITDVEANSLFNLGYIIGLEQYIDYAESIVPDYFSSIGSDSIVGDDFIEPPTMNYLIELICYGSKKLSQNIFEKILPLYENLDISNSDLTEAIGCTENQANIELFIKFFTNTSSMPFENKLNFLIGLFKRNAHARDPILNYILKNYKTIFISKSHHYIENYLDRFVPFVDDGVKMKVV